MRIPYHFERLIKLSCFLEVKTVRQFQVMEINHMVGFASRHDKGSLMF